MTTSVQTESTPAPLAGTWPIRRALSGRRISDWLAMVGLLAVMALVSDWALQHSSALTFQDDAAQTLSTATHLARGDGIVTSVMYYDSQLDQQAPAVQTVWPPALPALAAGLTGLTGWQPERSIIVMLLFAHLFTAIALGAVARLVLARPRAGRLLAISVALGWTIYTPALLNVTRGLSEPLFQCFAVLAMLALAIAARRADQSAGYRPWLMLAGLAAAGAIASRYQAVALLGPLAAAAMLVTPAGAPIRQRLGAGLITILPGAGVTAALLGRNWLTTRSLTGGAHSDRGQTLAEASARIGWLPENWQLAGMIVLMGSALLALILGLILWARCFDTCRHRPAMFGRRLRATLVFCLLAYSANTGLLIGLSLTSTVYLIELRYLTVNLLFLAIPAISAISCLAQRLIARPVNWHLSVGLPGLLLLFAVLQFLAFQSTVTARIEQAQPAKIRNILSTHQIEGESVLQWLQRPENRQATLMSSHVHGLALVMNRAPEHQRPMIGVPLPVFTDRPWTAGDIAALARRHSVHYVLAFRQMPTWVYRDPVNQLVDGPAQTNDWLQPMVVTDALFLARVAMPMISSRCHTPVSANVVSQSNRDCPRLIE